MTSVCQQVSIFLPTHLAPSWPLTYSSCPTAKGREEAIQAQQAADKAAEEAASSTNGASAAQKEAKEGSQEFDGPTSNGASSRPDIELEPAAETPSSQQAEVRIPSLTRSA